MTPPRKGTIRVFWLLNTLLLLAVLLPGALEHPYPMAVRPYVEWGGLLLWLVAGLCLLAISSRRRSPGAR